MNTLVKMGENAYVWLTEDHLTEEEWGRVRKMWDSLFPDIHLAILPRTAYFDDTKRKEQHGTPEEEGESLLGERR